MSSSSSEDTDVGDRGKDGKMDIKEILSHVDHTELSPAARLDDIKFLIDDAVKYSTATVCIPQSYVAQASEYAAGHMKICTVIGFPNGYDTTASKVFQASDSVKNGADEIDTVINIGWVKDGLYDRVQDEIAAIKDACGDRILKVIVETCLLTDDEKVRMCDVVYRGGADYIKTSTGFSKGGATDHDVTLFAEHVAPGLKIKAAGGISSLADAENFLRLGADRLGTSRIVKLVKNEESAGY